MLSETVHASWPLGAGIGACPLSRAAGGVLVDLHWQLSARRFPMPLTVNEVLDRAIPVRMGDQAVNIRPLD